MWDYYEKGNTFKMKNVVFLFVGFLVYLLLTESYESHFQTSGLSSAIIFLLSMAVFYFLNRVFGNKK